jgi:hypothetical protein
MPVPPNYNRLLNERTDEPPDPRQSIKLTIVEDPRVNAFQLGKGVLTV